MTTGRAGTWAKAAIAVLGALCLSPSAGAQDWRPNRNVRFVVGLPPGGMADVTARLLGPGLRDALGQTFILENLTGATGTIAAQAVPDQLVVVDEHDRRRAARAWRSSAWCRTVAGHGVLLGRGGRSSGRATSSPLCRRPPAAP